MHISVVCARFSRLYFLENNNDLEILQAYRKNAKTS